MMIRELLDIESYALSAYSIPSFLIALFTVLMGGYVFIRIHTSMIGYRFLLFTSALTLWQASFGMAYCSTNAAVSLWWSKLGVLGVVFIPITTYSFVTSILGPVPKDRRFTQTAYLVGVVLGLSALFSNLLVKGVKQFFWGPYPQFGVLGVVMIILYAPMLIKIFGTLWTGYKDATVERTRKRMKGLMLGLFIGYCSSVDFIPTFGITFYPFGYAAVFCFVAIYTYVITRYRLIDITAETTASQTLKTMQGAVIVIDLEERIRLINDTACIILGYQESEMVNKNLSGILTLPDELRDHRILSDRPISNAEVTFVNRPGQQVYLSLSGSVLTGPDGEPYGIIYVALDITHRKELETALARAKDEAEALVGERTAELSATVASLRNEIQEKLKVQRALTKAAEEWRITFDSTSDVVIMLNNKFEVVKVNMAARNVLGVSLSDVVGTPINSLTGYGSFLKDTDLFASLLQSMHRTVRELCIVEKGVSLLLTADPIIDPDGAFAGAVLIIRDVSEIKRAEDERNRLQSELVHVQKMESLGRLTGGIAHDFNNVMSAIMGYSELALYKLPDIHPARESIKVVMDAGEKAATLVRQLLAFSRKQVLEMKVVSVNAIIDDMKKMLDRLIGEDIRLVVKHSTDLKNVMADGGQLEQVLMNLMVNARDAMPGGGTIVVETSMVNANEEYVRRYEGMKPGMYAVLSVTDTGQGMSQEIQKKIFEPFFTTKAVGKGTGLGLATVYGIVKQHNGYIYVSSEIGKGTNFSVYLPVVDGDKEGNDLTRKELGLQRGTETILVVDDEPSLCKLIGSSLSSLGYKVIEACSAHEAMEISRQFEGTIDLLLTDVIMPEMDGKQLAQIFTAKRPTAKVVFVSGYTDDILATRGILESGIVYIEKPITPTILAKKVRQILDTGKETTPNMTARTHGRG